MFLSLVCISGLMKFVNGSCVNIPNLITIIAKTGQKNIHLDRFVGHAAEITPAKIHSCGIGTNRTV